MLFDPTTLDPLFLFSLLLIQLSFVPIRYSWFRCLEFRLSYKLQTRFDGRAALDLIPEYLAGPDHEENSETREEKNERRSINYER